MEKMLKKKKPLMRKRRKINQSVRIDFVNSAVGNVGHGKMSGSGLPSISQMGQSQELIYVRKKYQTQTKSRTMNGSKRTNVGLRSIELGKNREKSGERLRKKVYTLPTNQIDTEITRNQSIKTMSYGIQAVILNDPVQSSGQVIVHTAQSILSQAEKEKREANRLNRSDQYDAQIEETDRNKINERADDLGNLTSSGRVDEDRIDIVSEQVNQIGSTYSYQGLGLN